LDENTVSYSTYKKWFQQFREGNFNLQASEHPDQPKKWKTRSWSKFWMRILQIQLELASELGMTQQAFPIAYRSWKGFGRNPGESLMSGLTKQKRLWKSSQT